MARDTLLLDGPGRGQVVKTDSPLFTYLRRPGQEPVPYFRHRARMFGRAVLVGSVRDTLDDVPEAELFALLVSAEAQQCATPLPRRVEDVEGP
jgi:hypothetical protein